MIGLSNCQAIHLSHPPVEVTLCCNTHRLHFSSNEHICCTLIIFMFCISHCWFHLYAFWGKSVLVEAEILSSSLILDIHLYFTSFFVSLIGKFIILDIRPDFLVTQRHVFCARVANISYHCKLAIKNNLSHSTVPLRQIT